MDAMMAEIQLKAGNLSSREQFKAGDQVSVQEKTFVRWINYHLEQHPREIAVQDLYADLRNGVALITLLETFARRRAKGYTEEPTRKIQCLENITLALQFIQRKVKLVNIDANDIHSGARIPTLGLLWSLILYTMPASEKSQRKKKQQQKKQQQAAAAGDDAQEQDAEEEEDEEEEKELSPKAEMLEWVVEQIEPYDWIQMPTNWKSSWRDGSVLCALVDATHRRLFKKGVIKTKVLSDPAFDVGRAIEAAAQRFAVPKLLDAADVVERPDPQSLMAYVALIRQAKARVEAEQEAEEAAAAAEAAAAQEAEAAAAAQAREKGEAAAKEAESQEQEQQQEQQAAAAAAAGDGGDDAEDEFDVDKEAAEFLAEQAEKERKAKKEAEREARARAEEQEKAAAAEEEKAKERERRRRAKAKQQAAEEAARVKAEEEEEEERQRQRELKKRERRKQQEAAAAAAAAAELEAEKQKEKEQEREKRRRAQARQQEKEKAKEKEREREKAKEKERRRRKQEEEESKRSSGSGKRGSGSSGSSKSGKGKKKSDEAAAVAAKASGGGGFSARVLEPKCCMWRCRNAVALDGLCKDHAKEDAELRKSGRLGRDALRVSVRVVKNTVERAGTDTIVSFHFKVLATKPGQDPISMNAQCRFSDFDFFRKELDKEYKADKNLRAHHSDFPKFPPKPLKLFGDPFAFSFLEKRQHHLQRWLAGVMEVPGSTETRAFGDFFGLKKKTDEEGNTAWVKAPNPIVQPSRALAFSNFG